MGLGKLRVDKGREDKEIEQIVDGLIQAGEFKPPLLAKSVREGLKRLTSGRMDDYAKAMTRDRASPGNFWVEEDKERLAQCAWEHFDERFEEKMRLALIELFHESAAFAYPIFVRRCGGDDGEINEASPPRAELEQNVLRWSILRLKSLPYRKREGWDGEEENEALLPLTRAVVEISNNLAIWTYDHERICHLLRDAIRPLVKEHEDPEGEANFYANEAAEFIWDNIDGGLQAMVAILVEFSLILAKASATQRFREYVTDHEFRNVQVSASKLEEIADESGFRAWLGSLSVELTKRGRPPGVRKPQQKKRRQSTQTISRHLAEIEEAIITVYNEQGAQVLPQVSKTKVAKRLSITPKTLNNRLNAGAVRDWDNFWNETIRQRVGGGKAKK